MVKNSKEGNRAKATGDQEGNSGTSSPRPAYSKIEILDATLRERTFGVSFALGEKLSIASMLDSLGVDFIEYALPKNASGREGASSSAATSFSNQLSSVLRRGTQAILQYSENAPSARDDANEGKTQVGEENGDENHGSSIPSSIVSVRADCWWSHLIEPFSHRRIDPDENLRKLKSRISALGEAHGKDVFFSADHFFDGYSEDSVYALSIIKAAAEAGASRVVLCDSRGIATPDQVAKAVKLVVSNLSNEHEEILVGICAHNDCGLAVANTLAAVSAGAKHVQCTINGLGERAGCADLCQVLPLLNLRLGYTTLNSPLPKERQLLSLRALSRKVSDVSGIVSSQRPFVGERAFAHSDPSHVASVSYSPDTYETINPAFVGNARKMGVDDASLILGEMWELGLYSKEREAVASNVIAKMNDLEARGYKFDDAKASVHLLILDTLEVEIQPFQVLRWETSTISKVGAQPEVNGTIEVAIEEGHGEDKKMKNVIASAKGVGPIHAIDLALRRALESEFPELKDLKLISYSLNIVDSLNGTAAAARARTEFADRGPSQVDNMSMSGSLSPAEANASSSESPGTPAASSMTWATTAVSDDVLDASIRALIDGYRYKLIFKSSSARFALPDWKVALSWRYSERC